MSPIRSLLLAALASFSSFFPAHAEVELSVGFSDPEFIAYFRQAILARPALGPDDHAGPAVRFADPIRLLIVNATDESNTHLARLYDQATLVGTQISAATGLPIEIATASDKDALLEALSAKVRPNLIVVFGLIAFADNPDTSRRSDLAIKDRQFITPCKDAECASAIKIGLQASRTIPMSIIKVEPTDQTYARAAIAEGLLRAVSDANAVDAAYPSVLGWHRDAPFDRHGLSRMDRLMLRVLYNPRLTPNLTAPEIEALLPALLSEAKASSGD